MPQYKLTYFNLRGRAEISRYLFAYSGKEYEDHRIEAADWPKIKPRDWIQTFRQSEMIYLLSSSWPFTPDQFNTAFVYLKKTKGVLISASLDNLISRTTSQPSPWV